MKLKSLLILGLMLLTNLAIAASNRGAKGYSYKSANTSAVLIGGPTSTLTFGKSGPAVLYGVIMSSFGLTSADWILFRDSNTANTTSALALPPIAPTINLNGGMLTFDPPIQFQNGISYNLTNGVSSATVIWELGRVAGN